MNVDKKSLSITVANFKGFLLDNKIIDVGRNILWMQERARVSNGAIIILLVVYFSPRVSLSYPVTYVFSRWGGVYSGSRGLTARVHWSHPRCDFFLFEVSTRGTIHGL